MAGELATGFIQIVPTVQGIQRQLTRQIAAPAASIGSLAGRQAGKNFATGFLPSLAEVRRGVEKATAANISAARAVESSVAKVTAARRREETAAGAVRVAELRLAETRARSNASAAQIAAAEERLAAAQRTAAGAAEDLVAAESGLVAASQRAAAAQSELAAATARVGEAERAATVGAGEQAVALNSVSAAATRSTSAFAGIGGALAGAAKGLGIISGIAVAAGAALGGFGIKSAASLEQTTVAFTSLLGSAQEAHAEISDLQKFAAKTPFSQQDVFNYAQQYFALADSVGLAKDQVKPFLTAVGDIAAVTGASTENIHNAVMAIGQMGSAGKVTLENLNQISEAFPGFNGAAAIAAGTGQSTADVLKQISAGSLDAKTGVQALIEGMRKFQGAAGAMQKQSQTLNGLFSTFKDTISISLTKAFGPLIPTIKKLLSDLVPVVRSALNTFAPAITSFFKNIEPTLAPLIKGLSTAFAAIFDALGPALKAISPVIKPLADTFAQLVHAAQPLIVLLGKIIGQLGPPIIALFRDLITFLRPIVRALNQALAPILPVLAQAFRDLAKALAPVAKQLGKALADAITAIAPFLPDLVKAFAHLAVAAVKLVTPFLPIVDAFVKLAGMLTATLAKALTVIVEGFARLIDKLISVGGLVKTTFGFIKDALTSNGPTWDAWSDKVFGAFHHAATGAGIFQTAMISIAAGMEQVIAAGQLLATSLGGLQVGAQAVVNAGADLVNHAAQQAQQQLGLSTPKLDLGGAAGTKLPPFDKSTLTSFLQQVLGTSINPLRAALNQILASAKAAGKNLTDSFISQLQGENTRLIGLTKQRDEITKRLEAAQQRLANLRQARAQIVSSVRGAITGGFDITTAGQNDFGEPVTFFDLRGALATALRNAKSFTRVMKKLAKEGLPDTLLRQLAEAGPGALPQAQALLSATPKQLAAFKSQFRQLTTQGTKLGRFIGQDLKGAGIQAAEGLIAGLRSKRSALVDAIRDLARAMVDQLKKSLGISSPSKVMAQLGAFSGEGFAAGLASKYGAVVSEANRLANGALPRSQMQAWQAANGGQGSGMTVHYAPVINNPVPETATRSEGRALRALRNQLDA